MAVTTQVDPARRPTPEPDSTPAEGLGLSAATALIVGSIVGVGIFNLPTALAAFGRISLVSMGLTTVGAIALALLSAALARRMPAEGGPYAYAPHRPRTPLTDSEEPTVNTSATHPDCREALRDLMGDALLPEEPEAINELIARVLRRAHQTAEDLNTPSDARVILHVAHLFADKLATTNPQFDRVGFVTSATQVVTR